MKCASCVQECDGPCWAEQFTPIYDRAGRHGGFCWGGIFPRSKDYPITAAEEESEIQDLNEQLGLW